MPSAPCCSCCLWWVMLFASPASVLFSCLLALLRSLRVLVCYITVIVTAMSYMYTSAWVYAPRGLRFGPGWAGSRAQARLHLSLPRMLPSTRSYLLIPQARPRHEDMTAVLAVVAPELLQRLPAGHHVCNMPCSGDDDEARRVGGRARPEQSRTKANGGRPIAR